MPSRLVDQVGPVLIIRTDSHARGEEYEAGCGDCSWVTQPLSTSGEAVQLAYEHIDQYHQERK